VLGAIVPLAFDALAPVTGLYSGSALNRFITGALFGFLISSLLVRGLVEFAHEASWRRCAMQSPQPKGDIS
jgi:hypothetical protein